VWILGGLLEVFSSLIFAKPPWHNLIAAELGIYISNL
jgi:hypothetical protein